MTRAEQSFFLAIPKSEYNTTLRRTAHLFYSTCNLQHRRHTRGVVICSIVAAVAINCNSNAHMVIVRSHHHILIALAGNNGKYIVHFTTVDNKRLQISIVSKRPNAPLPKQRYNIFSCHATTLFTGIAPLQRIGRKRFNKNPSIG